MRILIKTVYATKDHKRRLLIIIRNFNSRTGVHEDHVTERPPPPVIEVVVTAPTIQIVEVGSRIRLGCTARYIVSKVWQQMLGSTSQTF